MCPHVILLYICSHTTTDVSSYYYIIHTTYNAGRLGGLLEQYSGLLSCKSGLVYCRQEIFTAGTAIFYFFPLFLFLAYKTKRTSLKFKLDVLCRTNSPDVGASLLSTAGKYLLRVTT